MKLNKQQMFDKLDKIKKTGAHGLSIEHTSQAVRIEYTVDSRRAFDLIMTTRVIVRNDAHKISNRSKAVKDAAIKYNRWLQEWKENGDQG